MIKLYADKNETIEIHWQEPETEEERLLTEMQRTPIEDEEEARMHDERFAVKSDKSLLQANESNTEKEEAPLRPMTVYTFMAPKYQYVRVGENYMRYSKDRRTREDIERTTFYNNKKKYDIHA